MREQVRNADDVIKIVVPYFYGKGGEIPAQIREETIQAIKKILINLNGIAYSYDGFASLCSVCQGLKGKVTFIESQGRSPEVDPQMRPIPNGMLEELTIFEESRGIRENAGNRASDVTPPNKIEYTDGSALWIYDYLYMDLDHPEGDPVHLVEHFNASGEFSGRYYYPRSHYDEGLLEAEYNPAPED